MKGAAHMAEKGVQTETFATVEIASSEALRSWLQDNHAREDSVWLITFKKNVPAKHVSASAVLDALIAFGWIDGLRRKLDEERTMQLISQRRQRAWTKTYKDRAERLEADGLMAEPGRAAIAQSKASGLWNASDPIDALEIPPDLSAALDHDGPADAFFRGAAPSYRRNVLRWIAAAKKPETRAKRISETVKISARRQKIPQL